MLGLRSKGTLEALYGGDRLSAREIERLMVASHSGVLHALDGFGIPRNGDGRKRTATCRSDPTIWATSS